MAGTSSLPRHSRPPVIGKVVGGGLIALGAAVAFYAGNVHRSEGVPSATVKFEWMDLGIDILYVAGLVSVLLGFLVAIGFQHVLNRRAFVVAVIAAGGSLAVLSGPYLIAAATGQSYAWLEKAETIRTGGLLLLIVISEAVERIKRRRQSGTSNAEPHA